MGTFTNPSDCGIRTAKSANHKLGMLGTIRTKQRRQHRSNPERRQPDADWVLHPLDHSKALWQSSLPGERYPSTQQKLAVVLLNGQRGEMWDVL